MIYFYNTYLGIGGAENLIFSLIKEASFNEIELGLIGIDHGYLYSRLTDENLSFIFINHEKINRFKEFNTNDILIIFGNFYGISNLKYFPGKVIVWAILYSSITTWNRFIFEKRIFGRNIFSHLFTKRLIKKLLAKDSLVAMDGNVRVELIRFTGKMLTIPLIPIPVGRISEVNQYMEFHERKNEYINVTYIGRGDDIWKIKPLKKIAYDLNYLKGKITLHIFTDNDFFYKKEVNDINIECNYHFGFYGQQLDEKLIELSDIHFSMGTSALEAAKLGIPTILIDASYSDFPSDYKYNWLSNSYDYNLGNFITNLSKNEGLTMAQVLNVLSNFENLSKISQESLQYVRENHSIDSILDSVINIKPKACINDILRFTPASWV